MHRNLTAFAVATALFLAAVGLAPVRAADKPAAPPANTAAAPSPKAGSTAQAPPGSDPFALASAYQSGFLEIVGAACYQLYTSMGIIATDLTKGNINGATAVNALDHNAVLLSACATNLENIRGLTPQDDAQATTILGRLGALIDSLGDLHRALEDAATTPSNDRKALAAASDAVNAARAKVEAALDAYGKPL